MHTSVNYTHLLNWSAPSCYLTIAVLNDYYSEVTAYTVLASFVFTTRMDTKVTHTDDTNYSYNMKPQTLFNQSYWVYITSLVINNQTHTHTHTHTYRHSRTEAILRNQASTGLWPAHAWFSNDSNICKNYRVKLWQMLFEFAKFSTTKVSTIR